PPPPVSPARGSEGPLHAEAVAHADVLAQHRRPLPAAADLLENPLLVEEIVELELNLNPIAREVLVDDAERVERLLERVLVAAGAGIEDPLPERVVVEVSAVPAVGRVIAERRVRHPLGVSGESARPIRQI